MEKEITLISCFLPGLNFINLGDALQTLAIKFLLKNNGYSNINYINRFEIFKSKNKTLIFNGWLDPDIKNFNVDNSNKCYYFGIHIPNKYKYFKDNCFLYSDNIGCRDLYTRDFLNDIKYQSVFCGCPTLTFKKRNNYKYKYLYCIDFNDLDVINKYKENDNIIYKSAIYHHFNKIKDWNQIEEIAWNYINDIKYNAYLVLTSRVHVYLPCISMGIPCVFIKDNKIKWLGTEDNRLSIIHKINENNIDDIREKIKENFSNMINNKKMFNIL